MTRGKPRSGAGVLARPFRIRWDEGRLRWAVIQGARWRFAEQLCVQVTTTSQQGCLEGVGVVRVLKRGELVITS